MAREDCGGDCGNCERCRDRERQEERHSNRSAFQVPDPIGDEQAEDQERFFDHNDAAAEKEDSGG